MERLTNERILAAAVELADRDGFEGLSMRRLAEAMGVGAMSLYHYVPNKQELLVGMIDIVFGEIDPPSIGGDWKAEMRKRAVSTRAALLRHRWAIGRMESSAVPGPTSIRLHEATLGCLREAGFSVPETIQAQSVQDSYIYGFTLQEKTLPFDDAAGSTEVAASQAEQVEMAKHYPYLAEVVAGHVAQVGYDFDEAFQYGLDLILDALDSRRGEGRD